MSGRSHLRSSSLRAKRELEETPSRRELARTSHLLEARGEAQAAELAAVRKGEVPDYFERSRQPNVLYTAMAEGTPTDLQHTLGQLNLHKRPAMQGCKHPDALDVRTEDDSGYLLQPD